MEQEIPAEVVAAIGVALSCYLETAPRRYRLVVSGPTPEGRQDAGLYGAFGLLNLMQRRGGAER